MRPLDKNISNDGVFIKQELQAKNLLRTELCRILDWV